MPKFFIFKDDQEVGISLRSLHKEEEFDLVLVDREGNVLKDGYILSLRIRGGKLTLMRYPNQRDEFILTDTETRIMLKDCNLMPF